MKKPTKKPVTKN